MSKKYKRALIVVVLCVLFAIILFDSFTGKDETYVKQWYQKAIVFPDSMTFYHWGKEPVDYDFSDAQYKALILLDSVSCISCQLRLDDWQRFMADIDSLTEAKLSFVFVMRPVSKHELYMTLRVENFEIPVCVDDRKIRQINDIPNDGSHVFLLDYSNEIICVGNPIVHRTIRDLYLEILKKKQ